MLSDLGYSNYITVSQLNSYIHNSLAAESLLSGVVVYGEISGYKISGAHAYFSLKDSSAVISCNCFNYASKYIVTEGESVLIKGNVDYYAKGGRLSLIVQEIQPVGKGLLHLKLEQLKAKLAAEGLFDEKLKQPIPVFVRRAVILTSRTGAVIRDIIKTVRAKNKVMDLYVYDVRVQGSGAAESIISALGAVDDMGFDVIVITRGGGSFEDLYCFNDEKLARTIVSCRTPIISAVGHQTDFTICDMAADVRAATPTAAGELIAYDVEAVLSRMASFVQTGVGILNGINERNTKDLKRAYDRLKVGYTTYLDRCERTLRDKLSVLQAHDPILTLERGFFRVSVDGAPISDTSQLPEGAEFSLVGYNAAEKRTEELPCRRLPKGE